MTVAKFQILRLDLQPASYQHEPAVIPAPGHSGGMAASIEAIDDFLRSISTMSGEPAFLRAANALYQQPSGRPSINDGKLIDEARWMVQHGKCKSINQALQKVARTVVDEDRVKSVAERLRRKMRSDAKIDPRNGLSG